jgi:hypothetical protein
VTTQVFSVTILDDALVEGDESIRLSLSAPVIATLGTPARVNLVIRDNE